LNGHELLSHGSRRH